MTNEMTQNEIKEYRNSIVGQIYNETCDYCDEKMLDCECDYCAECGQIDMECDC